ncbi:MAG: hypothetical protein Tsb0016_25090 [Sphingomonadales bacterium]
MSVYLKDAAANLDYSIDWAAGYLTDGQVVTASTWTIEPDDASEGGLTISAEAVNATLTSVTVAGGVPGRHYRLINRISLSNGLSDERSLVLRVDEN